MSEVQIRPLDSHNRTLVDNVHPSDWVNPTPSGRYNLVVLGAGSAGLISALVASSLGAKVALVERHLMGGDCLNVGCVPSKALIRQARRVAEVRRSEDLGLAPPQEQLPNFETAMEWVRKVRAEISSEDSALRYSDEFGIDVYLGNATFTGRNSVDVDGTTLEFAKAVIATGGRPVAPPIEGLAETGYRTNEDLFELTERPARLGVIGSGPIGCEIAQSFQRLGTQVVVLERADQILTREDRGAAAIVQRVLVADGVDLRLGAGVERVERKGQEILLHVATEAGTDQVAVDELLVAVGRTPNIEALGLEEAGVSSTRHGVVVDDHLRTTNKNIFAAGDVCMRWKFTHAADAAAKIVVQNALFFGRKKVSDLVMPWCTYTDPEIAHVGLYAHEAEEQGIAIDTYEVPLSRNNRAVADGEEDGFVKIHTQKGKDKILGATIVAAHAGDIISQVTLAMNHGIGLGAFGNMIFPYPTQAEILRAASSAYTKTKLTPTIARVFEWLMRLRR